LEEDGVHIAATDPTISDLYLSPVLIGQRWLFYLAISDIRERAPKDRPVERADDLGDEVTRDAFDKLYRLHVIKPKSRSLKTSN